MLQKFLILSIIITKCLANDITNLVFGSITDGLPAAFGDFNSDELTDVFVLRDGTRTVQILLAAEEEPLLRPGINMQCTFANNVTSVVPGDFDGDAFMDVLVTTFDTKNRKTFAYVLWGALNNLSCTTETPLIEMIGQPLAIDYNQDMIIDLFGVNKDKKRAFWIFGTNRTAPRELLMNVSSDAPAIRYPHSNAFLDVNADYTADLFLTTKDHFEIWYGSEIDREFIFNNTIIPKPPGYHIGQSIFIDVELIGQMDLITPVCYDKGCENSTILVYKKDTWQDLNIDFKDTDNRVWGFVDPNGKDGQLYTNVITLRSGDFNMDGYPDILATLKPNPNGAPQSFFLENVHCETGCGSLNRTYVIRWKALRPFNNNTVMAVFYDFYQDGILDLIFVQKSMTSPTSPYKISAFRNNLDYDATFIKVMVLTGLTNSNNHMIVGNLGKKKRTYGTNLPGPRISIKFRQEAKLRRAVSAQLPQSAHFSLNLPFTIFGLGRTPNFVDTLTVGLSNRSRDWTQIIPNSQMVVIPWPTDEPSKWKAQLFVTPSKLILMSVAGLTGLCGIITLIILGLYWKERQEDRKERLQESHRFHFDAM
ncbi:T-cell immunomodulatory protein [Chrysoperla carnea]|uniref:T-cell immunomodulatory protein n=1 Tax=Chrysoperla carnea TaxID=189513 RepID=UPI001D06F24C|nr:T-cell immunomodulatory protein [Chrysoperla carnea]